MTTQLEITYKYFLAIMLLFYILLGLCACDSDRYDDLDSQTTAKFLTGSITATKATPEVEKTITPSLSLTASLIPPTKTPTPSITVLDSSPTPSKLSDIDQELTIIDEFPGDGTYEGLLVLRGSENPGIIFNLATGQVQLFPFDEESEASLGRALVSPDNQKIVYSEPDFDNNARLFTIKSFEPGGASNQHILDDLWWFVETWTVENRLLLSKECAVYLLLDPENGAREPFHVDLPNQLDPRGQGWGASLYCPVVSPDLSRVVYLGEPDMGAYAIIVLWDLESNQRLLRLTSGNNPWGGEPVWSRDGNSFILTLDNSTPDELFKVTKNGEVTQLTHLGDIFTKRLIIQSYELSPDNNQIAFWMWYGWDKYVTEQRFAVHNLLTEETTIYNLQGYEHSSPVWSPEGDAVVIVSYINDEKVILLVDLSKNVAYKIAGDYYPVGWLVSNP
jgi:Tol biopolymer transport system component